MKKIAVIGSINMDMTVQTQRHPKVGETVAGHHLSYIPGGKGANQAVGGSQTWRQRDYVWLCGR